MSEEHLEERLAPENPDRLTKFFYTLAGFLERHWLLAFNTFWGGFVILPWLAPVFMNLGWILPGRIIYLIYMFFCHQLPERSWFLYGPEFSYTQERISQYWDISHELIRRQFNGNEFLGWKVAWSDRMVAMYTTIFIFGLVYAWLRQRGLQFKPLPWWGFCLCLVPLGVDGTTHLINDALRLDFRATNEWAVALTQGILPPELYLDDLFGSLNSVLRLITGFIFGLGVVGFLWPLMDREFGQQQIYRKSIAANPLQARSLDELLNPTDTAGQEQ